MGLSRKNEDVNVEDFENSKEEQEENIREVLAKVSDEILVFTDGSALGNPGAGAVVYCGGYGKIPVKLKQSVSKSSNNYHGELVGLKIALEFLEEADMVQRTIHIFTDCQPAIKAAFGTGIPKSKIALSLEIRRHVDKIKERQDIIVHWVPGHMGITGNELADGLAKVAAREAERMAEELNIRLDSKEVVKRFKKNMEDKWNWKHQMSETNHHVAELLDTVGKRSTTGDKYRKNFTHLNQLMSGHSKLNGHMLKIDANKSPLCDKCNVVENTSHFLFHCQKFEEEINFDPHHHD